MDEKKKVVFLLGATGTGKSSTAIKLAKKFNMEIISSDSVQVYKYFDIGSAKIKRDEMEGIVHYGLDLVEPNQDFSVSEFVDYTKKKIEEIDKKGKLPLVVGGTGLYIKAFVEGYNFGGTKKHQDFRDSLEKLVQEKGIEALYNKLKEMSEIEALKVDKHNKPRIIRALEILTFGDEKKREEVDYDCLVLALNQDRQKLYERINKRVQKMVEEGLVNEVQNLYQKYGECQPMRAIGYKEVIPYLEGKISKEEMIELISQHTRNYAKRQITFMKGIESLQMFDIDDENYLEKMEEKIKTWLNIH